MLDLDKFAKPKQAIVPIVSGFFRYENKQYRVRVDDGWHLIEITNNKAKHIEPTTLSGCNYKSVLGYTHNNSIVFQNFDVAKRLKLGISTPLFLNQSQTFEAVKAVVWENGHVYWAEPNYSDAKIYELKDLLDQEKPLADAKGITPELRTLFLHHALERVNMRKLAEETQRAEEHERLMKDIPYRLKVTFERAGAELVHYSMSGLRIIVDWKIPGSDHEYNSVLDSRTWMVVEAGYCMSNDDKRHNITSMVKLAEDYEERGVTFITRN